MFRNGKTRLTKMKQNKRLFVVLCACTHYDVPKKEWYVDCSGQKGSFHVMFSQHLLTFRILFSFWCSVTGQMICLYLWGHHVFFRSRKLDQKSVISLNQCIISSARLTALKSLKKKFHHKERMFQATNKILSNVTSYLALCCLDSHVLMFWVVYVNVWRKGQSEDEYG